MDSQTSFESAELKFQKSHDVDALAFFEKPESKNYPISSEILIFDCFDDAAPAHTHRFWVFLVLQGTKGRYIFPFFYAYYTGGNAEYQSTYGNRVRLIVQGLTGVTGIKTNFLDRGANADFQNANFESAFDGYYESEYQYAFAKNTAFNNTYTMYYDFMAWRDIQYDLDVSSEPSDAKKKQLQRRLNKVISANAEKIESETIKYDFGTQVGAKQTVVPEEKPAPETLGDMEFPITEGMHAAFFDGHTFYFPNGFSVNTLMTRQINKILIELGLCPSGSKMFLALNLAINPFGVSTVLFVLSCYHFVAYGRKKDYPYPFTSDYQELYRTLDRPMQDSNFLYKLLRNDLTYGQFLLPKMGEIIISPERCAELGLQAEKVSFAGQLKDLIK